MKTKLKFFVLVLSVIAISMCLFVSCGGSSSDASAGICGRWQMIDGSLYFKNGIHISVDRPKNYFIEIYDDGSCSIISSGELIAGEYKLDDDTIELDFYYSDTMVGVMADHEVQGDELVLYTEKTDFPSEGIAHFKRVGDSEIKDNIKRVHRAYVTEISGVRPVILLKDGTAILAGRDGAYEISGNELTLIDKGGFTKGSTYVYTMKHDEYIFEDDRLLAIRYDIPTRNTIRGIYDIVDKDAMVVINKDKMYFMDTSKNQEIVLVGKYKVTNKNKEHYKATARLRYYGKDEPKQEIEFIVNINPNNGKGDILEITSDHDFIKNYGNSFRRFYMDNYCYREVVDE